LKRAEHTLEATNANDYESDLLEVVVGAAMILLEGVTYLEQEQPVEYFKAIYRGDRFKFKLESQRNRTAEITAHPRFRMVLDE
jgi:GntR family transcriptional regulator